MHFVMHMNRLHRGAGADLEVLLVHPGGPFWPRKDDGARSIPEGEYDADEHPWNATLREFAGEMGTAAPDGPRRELGAVRQSGGKVVTGFAVEADFDPADIRSNTVDMEWPRGSGRRLQFPEVDRAEWFGVDQARRKLLKGQLPLLDRLCEDIGAGSPL